jgi:hypothetical protein
MAVPHDSGNFGDLLDPRFQDIFDEQYRQLPDMLPTLFSMPPTNGRDNMRWSEVGAYGDWDEFTGTVNYDSVTQGFDTVSTPVEFASGAQIRRKLFDDDQFQIMDQRPAGIATAAVRTRQKHGARILNNAFSVDSFFYVNSEGVALCSNSHTTNAPNTSTATGFDNLGTSALSAVSVSSARTNMRKFRDDRANRMTVMPNELWIPIDLADAADEIVKSDLRSDTAENATNVQRGRWTIHEWEYLTDTNNWFMVDSTHRKAMLFWIDRIAVEFAFAEDIDTLIAKWRGYMRYSNAWIDWRWVFGQQVS